MSVLHCLLQIIKLCHVVVMFASLTMNDLEYIYLFVYTCSCVRVYVTYVLSARQLTDLPVCLHPYLLLCLHTRPPQNTALLYCVTTMSPWLHVTTVTPWHGLENVGAWPRV